MNIFGLKLQRRNAAHSAHANDNRWSEIAQWSSELGISTWGGEIVSMPQIHPFLFMGSRLSAQRIIDGQELKDTQGKVYAGQQFDTVCIASDSTCEYCNISERYKRFLLRDQEFRDASFLKHAVAAAAAMHAKLMKGKHILVHCHSGRNRCALAILMYCCKYTNFSYEHALYLIRLQNSKRFSMQSTLQNSSFTRYARLNWDKIRSNSTL